MCAVNMCTHDTVVRGIRSYYHVIKTEFDLHGDGHKRKCYQEIGSESITLMFVLIFMGGVCSILDDLGSTCRRSLLYNDIL